MVSWPQPGCNIAVDLFGGLHSNFPASFSREHT
jgi:hypothetical protein